MNLSDIHKVNRLFDIRNKLIRARTENEMFMEAIEPADEKDLGEVGEGGFWAHISKHTDGSGDSIDLSGCYVARDIGTALRDVITRKLTQVDAFLEALGVVIEEEPDDGVLFDLDDLGTTTTE